MLLLCTITIGDSNYHDDGGCSDGDHDEYDRNNDALCY